MAALRADIDLRVNSQGVKRSLDKATSEINKAVNKISGKTVNFNVNGKSFTQPLGRINASANEFTKSLEASNARVIAFGASVAILDGISDSFKALVSEAVAFEKTLADINVVLNLSNQQIQQFGDGLFEAARNTAQGFNVASEAAIEFARQGLSTEEVLKRTNDALILTRLTSLKASDAVAGLTAAVNAFGDAGLTTTDIIDKLSAVDVNFAVSSEDLINALQRAGAVAIDAGVEFDSLVGLVAALQQTTARGGAVIGNSLKTIFTRIQRPESIRQLEEMGVAVRELSGSILPADKILLNIAKTFDALTQSQQSNVVQFSAGIFQANVFRAALRDLAKEQSLHVKATDISANAAGEAAIKNEKLNKTLAAMASQTGTGLQELAQTMGDLSLSPAIGDALEFINERIKELKGSLGGGEEEGSTFAKGLVRGIGNVITGPAAIAFGAIFIKLFINIAKFAKSSMKDVLGIVSQKEKLKQMEESIVNVLMQERFIQEGLNNLEGDRAAQETFILGILERQSNAMREQQKLAAAMAGRLLKAGVSPDLSPSSNFVDFDGDGRRDTFDSSRTINSYGGLNPEVVKKEKDGARKGGYSPGKVDQMNVPGVGKVVYNKAETVKKFPGMKQPAIIPPKQSRAGTTYKEAFTERHGFDPYASHGLIPNFATQVGGALEMDMGKLTLFGKRPDIERAFGIPSLEKEFKDAAGAPIVLEAQAGLEDIVKSTGAQDVTKTRLFKPFSAIAAQKGITTIQRPFQVRTLPRGQIKDAQDAERKTANLLNQEAKQSGLKQTHTLTSGAAKNKKGRNDYPVDIIAYGSDLNSHEVKSGKFSMANIISKSLRMSSDRELATWMSLNKVSGGSALTEANFKGAQSLAGKLKIAGTGAGGEFTQADADLWGMSKGLVPNFATEKEVFNKDGLTVSANKEYQLHDGSGFFMPTKGQTAVGLTDLIAGQLVDASGSLTSANVQLADLLNPSTVVSHRFPKTREAAGRSFEENLGPRAYLGRPPARTNRFDWETPTEGDVDLGAGKYSPDLDINPQTINNSILGEAATSAKAHTATDLINKAWNNSVAKSGLSYTYNNAGGEMIITMPDYLTEYVGAGQDGWALATNAINYSLGGATVSPEVHEAVKEGKKVSGKSKWIDPSKVYVEVFRDQVNAARGFVPNFTSTTLMRGQPVIEKDGQLIHPELAQPSVNQMLFEPLLKAETPDDVARIAAKFAVSHSSGPLAGRNREKTTGSIGDMFEERLSSSRVDEGKMRIWENDTDPYSADWISQGNDTLSSGAVSYSTNKNVAAMFTSGEHPATGKIHKKEIPKKLIFGERKIKKLLSRGADLEKTPPEYPMINLMKDSIYNDTFFDWWKEQGGLYLNLGGLDRDPIVSQNSLNDNGIYNEKEITQILSKGLVPNFARMYQINAKMASGKFQSGTLFSDGLFLKKQADIHSVLMEIDQEKQRFSGAQYRDKGYGITTFQMPDQNLKAMLSGVYSANQIRKLRALSDRFLNWYSPSYINDDEEYFLPEDEHFLEEARARKKGFEYISGKGEKPIKGTKANPMPLAGQGAWHKNKKSKFYLIPDTGVESGDIRDAFSRSDEEEIRRLFELKRIGTKEIDDKYLSNLAFADMMSGGDSNKIRAAQEGGLDKMKFATKTKNQGLLPNFAKDWVKIYSQIIQQRDTIDSREDFKKFGISNPSNTFPFDKSTTVQNSAIKSNLTPEQYDELWNIYHGLAHGAAKDWVEVYSQIIQQRDTIDSREDFKKFGVSNPANTFPFDKSTTLKNSAIKSNLTPEQYDELWNIYHGLERNPLKYDWRAIFKDLKKGKYQNRQDFFDQTGITQSIFNTMRSPTQLQGQTIQRHLGKQDYEKFRQLLKNLPGGTKYGAGAGKPAQYIRGDAFEKLIVEQAFDRVYSPGPGALDIENIDPSYFNDRNKKLFDIDGTYEHGDPIFTTNRQGHGSPKILKKLANSKSTSVIIRNKINDVLSKPGRRPNTIDLGAFPVADMIGNTSQKGIEFEDAEVMPVEIDSMPNVFRDIDPSTRLKFSYIKDYLTIPTKQHDLINSLQQGSKLPSSEQLGEGLNAKGLVPNFGYMPIHQTKNGKNYVWEKDLNIAKRQYPRAEFKQWDKNPKMYFVSGDTTYGRTQEEIEKDILKFSDERRVKEFGRFAASKGYPQVYAGLSKAITSEKVTSAYGRNYDRAAGKTRTVYPTQLSIPELKNVTVGDIDDIMLQDLYGSESFSNVGKKYASDFVKKPSGSRMVKLGTEEREFGTYKRGDLLPDTGLGPIPESTIRQLYGEFKSKHGASNGLVPNFTKQFVPSFANITDHEIIDNATGTITRYSTDTEMPGHAEIIGAKRGPENLKGGAFNNFNKLVKEFNQVGSGEVMPQRNGFGSTSWAKIVTMFPQIKQRIQKGLETEGSFRLNNLRNFDFDNLVGLKEITNTHFKQAEAAQDPKLTQDQREQEAQSSLLNGYKSQDPPTFYSLLTRKVQGDGDARAGFKNKGLIPNFADISSEMQSLATSNGLVPNFINAIDTDGAKNQLFKEWQDKMQEINKLASSGKPKAEIDPILSKLNGEANKIWDQMKQLKPSGLVRNFANKGFVPNYNVKLEGKNFEDAEIKQALGKIYQRKSKGKKADDESLDRAAQRYIALIEDHQKESEGGKYPGKPMTIDGVTFNSNEVALALNKQGNYYAPKEGETVEEYNQGLVPNFASMDKYTTDLWRGVTRPKGPNYTNKDVFELNPKRQNQFRSGDIYDIEGLKEYLVGHVDNQGGSSLVSTSTQEKTARDFATTKDPLKQGLISKKSISLKRIYNPKKVEKLINFVMDKKGWSEAKSVQWFLENAKNKDIGFHMKRFMDSGSSLEKSYGSENEVALLGKSAFAKTDNLAIASKGLVPNFSNPLNDAINREKAAGVPSSKIRIEKSSQLKSRANPMGLAVTNTRDEPAGINQGIRRAKRMKIDPKTHGASRGLIPNYANSEEDVDKVYEKASKSVKFDNLQKGIDKLSNSVGKLNNVVSDSVGVNQDRIDSDEEVVKASEGRAIGDLEGLQKLFFLQSGISMVNGFLQEFAETGSGATKQIAEMGNSATNVISTFIAAKELTGQIASMGGAQKESDTVSLTGSLLGGESKGLTEGISSFASSIKSASGGLGKIKAIAGGLLRFAPAIGQLVTVVGAANEVFKHFNDGEGLMSLFYSASERASKNIEKLSESTEALQAGFDSLTSRTENNEKIKKLEEIGSLRTQKQEVELQQLKMKDIDLQIKSQKAISKLFDENLMTSEIANKLQESFSSTSITIEEQKETLQKLIMVQKQRIAIEEGTKAFGDIIEDKLDNFFGLDSNDQKLLKQSSAFRGSQLGMSIGSVISSDQDTSDQEKLDILQQNINALSSLDLNRLSGSEGASQIKNEMIQGLKGTELFGSAIIAESISSMIDTIDNAEDNVNGLANIEVDATKDALAQLIKQLQKQKDSIQDAQMGNSISQSEAAIRAEYLKIIANYKKQNQDSLHQLSLLKSRNETENKILTSNNNLLQQYGAISKASKISKQNSLDIANIQSEFKEKLEKSNLEFSGSILGVAEKVINIEAVANTFKENLESAGEGANKLRDALSRDIEFGPLNNSIGINLDKGQQQEVQSSFASVVSNVSEIDDNSKIINNLFEQFKNLSDPIVKAAYLLALETKGIAKVTPELKNKIKELLDSMNRSAETAEEDFKNKRKILESEKIQKLIQEKTTQGAVEILKLVNDRKDINKALLKDLQGEADTLAALNYLQKDRIKTLLSSKAFDQKAYEMQVEKNRTDAESALLSLKQLQVQQELLRSSEDFKTTQQIKFQQEIISAGLSAQDAADKNEYLSYNETRKRLAQAQIDTETEELEITARNNLTKLKLLTQGEDLSKQIDLQIQEEITSAQSSALFTSAKALALTQMNQQGELLRKANELQESSNKLLELENAVRKANVSEAELRANVGIDLAKEKLGSIRETRESAARFSMTGNPEDALAFAQSLEKTNKALGNGTQAFDRLRVKMEEINVSAANLSGDLISTGIDGAKTGLKQLFEDISSGAKKSGEAWEDFGLNLAKKIFDRITEHNIDNIIKNFTYAFTGQDTQSDAEKITGSNNHLVEATKTLAGEMHSLRGQVAALTEALLKDIKDRPEIGSNREGSAPSIESPNVNRNKGAQINKQAAEQFAAAQAKRAADRIAEQVKAEKERRLAEDANNIPAITSVAQKASPAQNKELYPITVQELARQDLVGKNQEELTELARDAKRKADLNKGFLAKFGEGEPGEDIKKARRQKFSAQRNLDAETRKIENLKLSIAENETSQKTPEKIEQSRDVMMRRLQGSLNEVSRLEEEIKEANRVLESFQQSLDGAANIRSELSILEGNIKTINNELANRVTISTINTNPTTKTRRDFESGKLAALSNSETSQSGVKADNVNIDNISSEISSSLQQNSTSLDSNTSKVDQATNNVSEFSNALSSSAGQIEGLGNAVQNAITVINNAAASVKTNSSTTIINQSSSSTSSSSESNSTTNTNSTTNATSTTNSQSGGIIRRFNKGGFVQGPPGIDNVPAMLTAGEFVIPKEETRKLINGGIINKFDEGGTVEGDKGSFADRMTAGIKGAAQTAVLSAVASKYSADLPNSSGKKPPEFDMKRFETIDLGSTVSLHRADPRISAKRMAQDPVMQDYKKHLLDLAQYRVDETNRKQSEKQSRRMGLVQAGMSAVASFAVSKLSDALKEPMNKVVQKGENFVKGNLGLGKHSEAFKAAKEMSPDINYSDVADSIENKTPLSFDGYDYVPEVSKSGSTNWVSADRVKDFHKTGIDTSQANILSSIMSSQGRESGVDKLNKKIASDSSGFTDPKNFSPERRALRSQVSERTLPKPLQVLRKVPIVNNFIPSREAINNPGKGYNSNFGDVGSAFKRILGGGQTKEYTNHRGQIVRQQGIFPLSEQVEDAGFKKAREEYRQDILDSGGSDPGEYEDYSQSFFRDMFPMFKKTKRSQSGGTIRMFNEGGLNKGQGQVPAMLTAGEAFIPSSIAKRIGYETLNKINTTGEIPIVQGKGGIDNVGPVGLTEGDFIIKKSSTDKLLRENPNTMRFAIQNPEGFKRGDMGYYEGGIVGTGQSSKVYTPTAQPTRQSSQEQASPQNRISSLLQESNVQAKESSSAGTQAITNNINVSVKIDKNGKEQVSTEGAGGESKDSYEKEQELAMKIKSKVLEVIREEKRVGGELN